MPVYKLVQAQQRRASKRGRRDAALLSDEGDDLSDLDRSSADEAASDGESESDEDDDEDEDEDEDLLPRDDEEEEEELLDEDSPRPPPKGFPTATEALENQIASSKFLIADGEASDEEKGRDGDSDEEEEEEDLPLVCVVCPNKVLKKGRMVEVHLASKDHVRRLARFKAHLSSPDCPPAHADADARWVSSQIDKAVHERLSRQTAEGGAKKAAAAPAPSSPAAVPVASTSTAAPSSPAKSTPSTAAATSKKPKFSKPDAVAAATSAGTSVREQIRLQKKEKNKKRREAKREKNERIKRRKLDNGEELPQRPPPKRKFVEKVKPTEDEIRLRQEWKKARNEAREKGLPPPPKPVLAYEYGGKVPEAVAKRAERDAAKAAARGVAGPEGGKKGEASPRKAGVSPAKGKGGKGGDEVSAKALRRKEKKAQRKSAARQDDAVLPEV